MKKKRIYILSNLIYHDDTWHIFQLFLLLADCFSYLSVCGPLICMCSHKIFCLTRGSLVCSVPKKLSIASDSSSDCEPKQLLLFIWNIHQKKCAQTTNEMKDEIKIRKIKWILKATIQNIHMQAYIFGTHKKKNDTLFCYLYDTQTKFRLFASLF